MQCSIAMNKEWIENNYPKLKIEIKPLELRTFRGYREGAGTPQERLGTILNLHVRFKNPRPLKVHRFKLFTSELVVPAETGELRDQPHRASNGHRVLVGSELSPNLADRTTIDLDRDNITDGYLQFIVMNVLPEKMLNPSTFVVRLHVVDESTEEHKQDVTGLQWMGNN